MKVVLSSLVVAGTLATMFVANPAFAGSSLSGKTIVIDPGHGGHDPGALANGIREKDVTLAIAQQLQGILQAQGARVIMTRTTDTDVNPGASSEDAELQARVNVAQSAHASAFVSVHANFSGDPNFSGATTYFGPKCGYYSGASLSPTDVGRGYSLATRVQAALVSRTHEVDRGTPAQIFWVLGNPGIPSILVETGFISNKAEGAHLTDPGYQHVVADAIGDGLASYFGSGDAAGTPAAPASALADCSAPAPTNEHWVQTFLPAPLLSGADPNAKPFTTLPPFFYLKVLGQQGDYLFVLNPATNGPGYVLGSRVGPSGPPAAAPAQSSFSPFWVENFKPVELWSGSDAKAVSFGALPAWHFLQVVSPSSGPRFYVKVDNTANVAYVDRANVGPSGPPPSSPVQAAPSQFAAAARPVAAARATAAPPSTRQVKVQPGDTLFAIAARYKSSVPAVMALNHLSNSNLIMAGQTLSIPVAA